MSAQTPLSREELRWHQDRHIVAESPPGGGDDDDDRPKKASVPRSFEDF